MDHHDYMSIALEEARAAFELGEVPIGAVIVLDGEVVSRAHNMKEQWKDATAHAETVAINRAVKQLGHWRRLREAALYVTLEPCPMCAGAIVQSRIKLLVYGADDPKAGAVRSLMNIVQDPRLNHRVEVLAGVMEQECCGLMKDFFRRLRKPGEQEE
ncbi:tRNA adenosine(34) deaminase TadA [Phosphitispora fastidiosa]|uniref:tRNA adenosine(34) deaminase TadA n=1 Tax=Phosphitispora fastidiosa TaxID=2837202 RepID=UPI001E2B6AC1|nr:tRNA adenosine(34) deaminase TadA [Phosphitispora fastidiosa]MBU7007573.1 tRNA(adenine34) deaminase [Phosphitispora fastidiosa]